MKNASCLLFVFSFAPPSRNYNCHVNVGGLKPRLIEARISQLDSNDDFLNQAHAVSCSVSHGLVSCHFYIIL